MTALAHTLARATGIQITVETLKPIVALCGAGLVVWLMFATYGLDLSPGFF